MYYILHINKLPLLSYSTNSKLQMRWKRKPNNQKNDNKLQTLFQMLKFFM